jgi:hypothetical protein
MARMLAVPPPYDGRVTAHPILAIHDARSSNETFRRAPRARARARP